MNGPVQHCAICNSPLNPGDRYCGVCGASQPAATEGCPNCGSLYGPDDTFCGSCGAHLRDSAPSRGAKSTAKLIVIGAILAAGVGLFAVIMLRSDDRTETTEASSLPDPTLEDVQAAVAGEGEVVTVLSLSDASTAGAAYKVVRFELRTQDSAVHECSAELSPTPDGEWEAAGMECDEIEPVTTTTTTQPTTTTTTMSSTTLGLESDSPTASALVNGTWDMTYTDTDVEDIEGAVVGGTSERVWTITYTCSAPPCDAQTESVDPATGTAGGQATTFLEDGRYVWDLYSLISQCVDLSTGEVIVEEGFSVEYSTVYWPTQSTFNGDIETATELGGEIVGTWTVINDHPDCQSAPFERISISGVRSG